MVTSGDYPGLSRVQIVELLDLVATEAERRELSVSMFLVGGAAMVLAYSTARATRDLDGTFEPKPSSTRSPVRSRPSVRTSNFAATG